MNQGSVQVLESPAASHPAHGPVGPTPLDPASRSRPVTILLLVLRGWFAIMLSLFLADTLDIGVGEWTLMAAALAGIATGAWAAFSRLSGIGIGAAAAFLYGVWLLGYSFLNSLPPPDGDQTFRIFGVAQSLDALFTVFWLWFVSTAIFFRSRIAALVETFLALAALLYFLAGHRQLNFAAPKIINELAWDYGVDPLRILVYLGVASSVLALIYVVLASLPTRRFPTDPIPREYAPARRRFVLGAVLVALTGGIIYMVAEMAYTHYSGLGGSDAPNGVALDSKQGLSPLKFQSALGGTNQPAALVRLEGDYPENPFIPMLYLREGALSEYDGHEMVQATDEYDRDVSGNAPGAAFTGSEDPAVNTHRKELTQLVYLLAEHQQAFAVDYPISFQGIKNPNPKRFKASYKALSIAPAFKLEALLKTKPGDPRWSAETWKHYLEPAVDPRYQELALSIAKPTDPPVQKILAVTEYLSRMSIYTLTPNHELKAGEDPVVPYLFGDHRGYCVHFSHASVYLFRALGIPSRIGTGYLTDLSQSKDGHVLLRMSDRHAWSEVYFDGYGWIPFDIQPDQVESHADTQVDMQTLEELMQMLEPDEEILPAEESQAQKATGFGGGWRAPDWRDMMMLLVIGCALLTIAKLYVRFGWLLPGSPHARVRRAYAATASWLFDAGLPRRHGETRHEYRTRIGALLGADLLDVTRLLERGRYSRDGWSRVDGSEIEAMRDQDLRVLATTPRGTRIRAALNPASAWEALWRGRW